MRSAIDRFLQRIPQKLAQSFTPEQLSAIELHFGMRFRPSHTIDWRSRIGLPFAKFYIVVLAGREQRPLH